MLIINSIGITRPDKYRLPSPTLAPTLPFKVMAEDCRHGKASAVLTEPEPSALRRNRATIDAIRNSPFGDVIENVVIVTDDDDEYLRVEMHGSLRLRNRKRAYWNAWLKFAREHYASEKPDRYSDYF